MIHFIQIMKKVLLIVAGAIVLGGIGAGTYFFVTPNSVVPEKPDIVAVPRPTEKITLTTWDDPAGFTFSYPQGVVINKHDEDKENYAHIELTSATHPGSVIVWAKDLPNGVTDAESWIRKDVTLSATAALDTTMGTIAAKKILFTQPKKREIVGTVADGLLFYIDGVLTDESYWTQTIDAISQSFAIKPADEAATSDSAGVSEGAVDDEEVLQ